ncbi:hypothetical protein AB0N23_27395 [Streptomyces sp. NPDC052644]
MSRTALPAPVLRALAAAAAAVSFTQGRVWMGALWLLPAGLTSNLALYQARRGRRRTCGPAAPATPVGAAGTVCGGCAKRVCA